MLGDLEAAKLDALMGLPDVQVVVAACASLAGLDPEFAHPAVRVIINGIQVEMDGPNGRVELILTLKS